MQSYVQYVKYLIFGLRTGAVIDTGSPRLTVSQWEHMRWCCGPRSTERITKGKHKVKNVTLRSCTADYLGTLGFNFCIILNFIDIANS